MDTIHILTKSVFSPKEIEGALARGYQVENPRGDSIVVHGLGSRAYLYLDDEMTASVFPSLLLDYSDIELAKRVLEIIADDPDVTVDNDFGTVLPGDQFVARIRANSSWDWRRE